MKLFRLIGRLFRRRRPMSRPVRQIEIDAFGVRHRVPSHGRDDLRLLANAIRRAP